MKFHIYNYLKAASGPVKRPELLQALRVTANDLTIKDRKMRKVIEQMILEDGYLIASSEAGYHIIRTEEQLAGAMQYLTSKAEAIAIRKNTLLKNWKACKTNSAVIMTDLFSTAP